MKKINVLSLFVAIAMGFVANAQKIIDSESIVNFSLENRGSEVTGTLGGMKGDVIFDKEDLNKSSFNVTMDVNTINTANGKRDAHLKNEDFFEVDKYPEIRFKSSSAVKNADGSYTIKGDFTMKSVTKSVEINASVVTGDGQKFLAGQLPINRVDYKVGSADDGVGTLLTAHLKYPI